MEPNQVIGVRLRSIEFDKSSDLVPFVTSGRIVTSDLFGLNQSSRNYML